MVLDEVRERLLDTEEAAEEDQGILEDSKEARDNLTPLHFYSAFTIIA